MRRPGALLSGAWIVLAIALEAHATAPRPVASDLELPLAWEARDEAAARAPFTARRLGAGGDAAPWFVRTDPATGRVRMAYGGRARVASAVRSDDEAAALARAFVREHAALLGTGTDDLVLRNVRRHGAKRAVHFRQVEQGIPVWAADAFVLLTDDGRVAAFGSGFVNPPEERGVRPALDAATALDAAAASLGAVPRSDKDVVRELYWVEIPVGEEFRPALAYRVVFEALEPFGKWECFVHAGTGEILSRRNLYFPAFVGGDARGPVAANPPTYGWCSGYSPRPFPSLWVFDGSGGAVATADDGEFLVPVTGTEPVELTARLWGPWAQVHRDPALGADAETSVRVQPGFHGTLRFDGTNSRNDERTTFFHTNVAHDFMKTLDPGFTRLDYSMPCHVGLTSGFCPGNAWWDGHGTNYCRPGSTGSSYYNTGTLGNVIYHEYGHGVTQEVYLQNGAPEPPSGLHEGNSDVLANFIDRNPVIGYGFSSATGCDHGIRTAENDLTYPAENETGGHRAGQVIEAFHWLAWQGMLADLPRAEADDAAWRTWHEGRDLGTPRTFPDQVLWTFLADDDDGDLSNGTPHYDWFCPAAEAKGFECPEVRGPVAFTPEPMPHVTDGSAGFDFATDVVSSAGAIDGTKVTLWYRVNGGPFADVAMTPAGTPDRYSAHVPPIAPATAVEYFFEAADLVGNVGTSPSRAPEALHDFDVATVLDDLEHGVGGWTIGLFDDDATTGWWDLWDPVGTEAQPEDDATPGAGTLCFITGQCANGEGTCTSSCQISCNDVDNGRTVLLTPVYDLAGAAAVKVRYSRWFSADLGPVVDDAWVVDASNDGGATWVNAVTATASRAEWVTETVDIDALFGAADRVQLRFVASDTGEGSIVEAGVDDVRVLARYGPPTDAPASPGTSRVALELSAIRPNPSRGAVRIEFATPRDAPARLAVYDVAGRFVRGVHDGPLAAGAHVATWDGRDGAGIPVAPGVYFVRLAAPDGSRTRKVTWMP